MKYVFVYNPAAGDGSHFDKLKEGLSKYDGIKEYEIYKTKGSGDATRFVKEWCDTHALDEEVCFIACGGDGSINEVVNGVAENKNASFGVYACGSGNDFVKYFGGKDKFLDVDKIMNGTLKNIDLMKVNDRYCINVCHFGFDSVVAKTANEAKVQGLSDPYGRGVRKAIFHGRKNSITIKADGETITKKKMLLCTVANGGYVGGKYFCAPKAVIDDGYFEVCLANPCTLFQLITLIGKYEKGEHLSNPKFKKIIVYRRSKVIELSNDKPFDISLDGELINDKYFKIGMIEKGIRVLVPQD